MSRPQYETPRDRENEVRAIPAIEGAFRGVARKLPENHFADFVILDRKSRVISYVEYKKRNFVGGDYPTGMLSVTKFSKLVATRDIRVRSFFVVEDSAGDIRAINLHRADLDFRVEYGGRTVNTRDRRDVEPVAHISTEQFRTIGHVRNKHETDHPEQED